MAGMKSWMLGAAMAAGTLGLAVAPAQAAEFGVYARGPVAYVPPCPGPGYEWVAGYSAHGYWVPGRWAPPARRDRIERERILPQGRGWEHGRPYGWERR